MNIKTTTKKKKKKKNNNIRADLIGMSFYKKFIIGTI